MMPVRHQYAVTTNRFGHLEVMQGVPHQDNRLRGPFKFSPPGAPPLTLAEGMHIVRPDNALKMGTDAIMRNATLPGALLGRRKDGMAQAARA